MQLGVVKETATGELRVSQVPDTVAKLVKLGAAVVVERGAGERAGYDDAAYQQAGASLGSAADALGADVVVKLQPPSDAELACLKGGALLVCFLNSGALAEKLAAKKVDALAMERVPRTTRGQAVDALSSQANLAGYKAVLLGASLLPRLLPMMTTAAGTLTPAKVLVLGAGVAGLQAIATARRLGGVVSAFDVRPVVKEQVQSLGAKFVEVEGVAAEGQGGYAKEVAGDAQERILATLGKHVPQQDLVITTAQIPGKPAPRLVTAAMVAAMRRGSVIVDLAAESGGNCELTRAGEEVVCANGVVVAGPRNLPATVPFHASQMYARNVLALLQLVIAGGAVTLNLADELVAAMLVTHGGALRPR